jgi:hypothetical protein
MIGTRPIRAPGCYRGGVTKQAHDIVAFMREFNHELQSEYERIQKRAPEDPGTAGDEGEENWASLFRDWLSPNYHIVTKGRILTSLGEATPQVDVLVLRPEYPRKLLHKKHYISAGVLAAFECKTTLKRDGLEKAIKSTRSISQMLERERQSSEYRVNANPPTDPVYAALHRPMIYGLLAHSHNWAPEGALEKVSSLIAEFDAAHVSHPSEMIDLICVADLAVWSGQRAPYMLLPEKQFARGPDAGSCYSCHHKAGWAPSTIHFDSFTTIGSLIARLMRKLAYLDEGAAGIATYLVVAAKELAGGGAWRLWPRLLSDDLLAGFDRDWGNDVYP